MIIFLAFVRFWNCTKRIEPFVRTSVWGLVCHGNDLADVANHNCPISRIAASETRNTVKGFAVRAVGLTCFMH